jgi:hypothetical protein
MTRIGAGNSNGGTLFAAWEQTPTNLMFQQAIYIVHAHSSIEIAIMTLLFIQLLRGY